MDRAEVNAAIEGKTPPFLVTLAVCVSLLVSLMILICTVRMLWSCSKQLLHFLEGPSGSANNSSGNNQGSHGNLSHYQRDRQRRSCLRTSNDGRSARASVSYSPPPSYEAVILLEHSLDNVFVRCPKCNGFTCHQSRKASDSNELPSYVHRRRPGLKSTGAELKIFRTHTGSAEGAERVRAAGANATRPPKADGNRTGGPGGVLNPPAPPEAKNLQYN